MVFYNICELLFCWQMASMKNIILPFEDSVVRTNYNSPMKKYSMGPLSINNDELERKCAEISLKDVYLWCAVSTLESQASQYHSILYFKSRGIDILSSKIAILIPPCPCQITVSIQGFVGYII